MSETVLLGVGVAGLTGVLFLALGPSPEVGFVLQGFGVGAAIGTLVAHRARQRGYVQDPWLVTTRWSMGLGLVSVLIALAEAVA